MTDLARCQKEARDALAALIETGDFWALQGWVDWMIEMDYIALEVQDVDVCELPPDDRPRGIVSRLQAQRSAREGQGAGELPAMPANDARPGSI